MKVIILSSVLLALLSTFGYAELSPSAKANEQDYGIDILIYADKIQIAEKVSSYLQEQGLNVMPTNDPETMNSMALKNIQVVILVPAQSPKFSDNVLSSLKNYVYKGGNIIGIHDVISLQAIFSEIFGGNVGIVAYQQAKPELTITVRDKGYTHIMKDIPDIFTLDKEHSFAAVYKPSVHRLFEESYITVAGTTKKYCAGWVYNYGKGRAFYFSPGDAEETRYNLNVLKIIGNTANWMLQPQTLTIIPKSLPKVSNKKPNADILNPITPNPNIPKTKNEITASGVMGNEYSRGKMEGYTLAKGDPTWAFAGCFFGPLGVLAAYTYPQDPSINYITNQTIEYTFGFTESYRSECKNKNGGYAIAGWLGSWTALVLAYFILKE
jgi:trehalose utilization protein